MISYIYFDSNVEDPDPVQSRNFCWIYIQSNIVITLFVTGGLGEPIILKSGLRFFHMLDPESLQHFNTVASLKINLILREYRYRYFKYLTHHSLVCELNSINPNTTQNPDLSLQI
jgi:hypothetical protein